MSSQILDLATFDQSIKHINKVVQTWVFAVLKTKLPSSPVSYVRILDEFFNKLNIWQQFVPMSQV